MLRFSLSLIIIVVLCLPKSGTARTFTSQQDGNWHDPATWGETVDLPTSADSVLIDGHNVFLADFDASIAYLKVTNLSGSNVNIAQLNINGGITFSVSGDVDVIAENIDQEVNFIQSSTSIANITGDFSMTRVLGNTQTKSLKLDLSDDAQLYVVQNFTYDYLDGAESNYEIRLINNAQFTVDGTVNFTQSNGPEFLVTCTNATLLDFNDDFNISSSGGTGVNVSVNLSAELQVEKNLSVTNSGAVESKLGISIGGQATTKGNLTIQSSSASSNATVSTSGVGSLITVEGDITFSALANQDTYFTLAGGSHAYLGGSIIRPTNYGAIITTASDDFYFNGTVPQSIPQHKLGSAGTDSLDFKNIIFQNSAGMILSGDLIVVNDVELSSGIIQTTDAARLIVADGASITGGSASAYVDGPLVKRGSTNGSNFIFPVGNNGQYAPIEIGVVSDKDTEYKAKYTGCPPPVGHLVNTPIQTVLSAGYWELERADGGAVGDVKLHWSDADEVGIFDLADILVAYLKNTSTGWYSLGLGATTGNIGAGVSGTLAHDTGCPPPVGATIFAIGSTESLGPLPVELIKFEAEWNKSNNQVNLYWETGSEVNSDHFIVEKSYDGYSFSSIEERAAANSSSTVQYYSSVDRNPQKGNNYYRIMSVDQDGMMSFSKTINIFIKKYEELPIAYPNPVDDYIRIYSKALENQEVVVEVFEMTSGRRIHRNRHRASQGHLYLLADRLNMDKAGNYLLTYKDQGTTYTMKITKRP